MTLHFRKIKPSGIIYTYTITTLSKRNTKSMGRRLTSLATWQSIYSCYPKIAEFSTPVAHRYTRDNNILGRWESTFAMGFRQGTITFNLFALWKVNTSTKIFNRHK